MKKIISIIILCFGLIGSLTAQNGFAPQGAEWYFNISSFMSGPVSYYHMAVEGDTVIQGHVCSVITPHYLGGNGDRQFVYEDGGVVYWYNQTLNDFTTLYDFNAGAGDSWICEVDSCSIEFNVNSVTLAVWEDYIYEMQIAYCNMGSLQKMYYIIKGIGSTDGLFPYLDACSGEIYDGPYPEYMRCYLVDGEMLFHSGSYDCDEYGNCWDGTVAEAYAGGDGTPSNPYQIATSRQLALLAHQTNNGTGGNAYYELTAGINLTNCEGGIQPWISIGTIDHPFTGHFNGNGKNILNLNQIIDDGDLQPVCGLFGCTNAADISNVRLVQCYVSGNAYYTGALVGYAGLTNISNCSIYNGWAKTDRGLAGGLVGFAGLPYDEHGFNEQTFRISNCYVENAVNIEGTTCAGGIVGQVNKEDAQAPCVITNCSSGLRDNYYPAYGYKIQSQAVAGGIAGSMLNGKIDECTNAYIVTGGSGNYGTGGIVGEANNIVIDSCFNGWYVGDYGNIKGGGSVGGIVGRSISMENNKLDIFTCFNFGKVEFMASDIEQTVGGIAGSGASMVVCCTNRGEVVGNTSHGVQLGGISGANTGVIANCYNRGDLTVNVDELSESLPQVFVGGIVGSPAAKIYNVYNTGVVEGPDLSAFPNATMGYGNIIGYGTADCHYLNAYWLDNDLPACGNVNNPEQHGSSAFHSGFTGGYWDLNETQYGTNDLTTALNYGSVTVFSSVTEYPYLTVWTKGSPSNDKYPHWHSSVGPGVGGFELDGLAYSVISFDSATVCLEGLPDGQDGPDSLAIPETINFYGLDLTVTKIADYAFAYRGKWKHELIIPNTITEIGAHAFDYTAFTGPLVIPNSVVTIGEGAFYECLGFTDLSLPSSLRTIGASAFGKCSGMHGTLALPEGVTTIRSGAFCETPFTGSLTIPNSVTTIGIGAFRDCNFDGILTLPENMTEIEYEAFCNCRFTGRLNLPHTLKTIGSSAFKGCQFSDTLVIPESVRDIYSAAFYECDKLDVLVLRSGLVDIWESGFSNCTNLSAIFVYSSIPPLARDWAFDYIPNDIPVHIPQGSLYAYQDHYRWGYFTNFIDDIITLIKSEWYYEILNENGSITYEYLYQANDTVIDDETTHILVRIHTLYDKDEHVEISHDYIYEKDNKVYWWNKTLGKFTILYDFGAEAGDQWELKVGTASLMMHVDAVGQYEYGDRIFKLLRVSDANNLFSGDIVCGIGHLTSFFPEKLMNQGKGYRVEGIRCFWQENELMFKNGDKDCDEVYEEYHNYGVEEPTPENDWAIYPNPANGTITISGDQTGEYQIANIMGQTLMTGRFDTEKQQINVSALPAGVYFINIDGKTTKFVKY